MSPKAVRPARWGKRGREQISYIVIDQGPRAHLPLGSNGQNSAEIPSLEIVPAFANAEIYGPDTGRKGFSIRKVRN